MTDENGPNSSPSFRISHTNMPKVAGILNIISGIIIIMISFGGCKNVINAGRTQDAWMFALLIPGSLALVSGIYARRRTTWFLALTGSICAIPAVLGIASTVLITLSRNEFKYSACLNLNNSSFRYLFLSMPDASELMSI
jgi:hypothetical protein